MQNPQISPAEWFRNAPSFIPAEEVKALKDRATAHMRREREEVLRRAAELDAELRALSGEPESQVDEEEEGEGEEAPELRANAPIPTAAQEARPDSTWSNRAILTHFARHNPGARAADYIKYLASFRPGVPEKTTQSNVYDTLKVLKRDEIVKAVGPRGDSQYFHQEAAKKHP